MSSTKAIVRVQPKGLGGRDLLHWQTEPMTKELDDEIARVRDEINRCGTGKTTSASSLDPRGHGHFRFRPAACVPTPIHWLPKVQYIQSHIRSFRTMHYERFVDGFWLLVSDALRLLNCHRTAARLTAWHDRIICN
jgi:hypothetical protein